MDDREKCGKVKLEGPILDVREGEPEVGRYRTEGLSLSSGIYRSVVL
jgi:hypothetical protein